MIPTQKNEQVKRDIIKIIEQSHKIKKIIKITLQYVHFSQQHYSTYCKDIFTGMINFENKISKASLYEPDKTNIILRLSTLYREFHAHIQNYSQVNLIKLPHQKQLDQLNKYTYQLDKKSDTFQTQFKNYLNTINQHNPIYQKYINDCQILDEIITKFKSYSDPLKFYNKSITSQYQQRLQNALNSSKNQETKVTTQLQLLDSKRKFINQLLIEIRQLYISLFHGCLKFFHHIISQLIVPIKNHIQINKFNTKLSQQMEQKSSKNADNYQIQFQRLSTFTNFIGQGNQIMKDFNQIMNDRNSKNYDNQLIQDHKLFKVRCDNLKKRKQLAFKQTLNLQENLFYVLSIQIKKYKQFEKQFKENQRNIFGLVGKDIYKKQFQTYFGIKSSQLNEFFLNLVQMPRKSFEKINLWMLENFNILKQIIQTKKEQILKFNKLYDQIMIQHLKQKQKYENQGVLNSQINSIYRTNIVQSLDQFRYIFSELEFKQTQKDKIVTQKIIQMHQLVKMQYNQCRIQNINQKNQKSVIMIKNFKIINEALQLFKSNPLYNILYQDYFGQSLQRKFQSRINQQEYQETQIILKQKQKIAKKMLKRQIGCCGFVKAEPIKSEILSTYKCYLYEQYKSYPYGVFKILKQGITFEESRWNICSSKVFILIPNSDINSIDLKALSQKILQDISQGISIKTEKGELIFMTNNYDKMFQDLQKIYGQTYRKSMGIDRKTAGRNDSTSSGSKTLRGTSMILGYNKQENVFIQQPVCFNPSLSKGSNKQVMDSQNRFNGAFSNFSLKTQTQQLKHKKNIIKSEKVIKKQKQIKKILEVLLTHFQKHQFLPQYFLYILNKNYKSKQRKDYKFKDRQTFNEFILKQLKKNKYIETQKGIILVVIYQWKITYPDNISLHSFKHGQKIIIDFNTQPPILSIIQWPHIKQQNFNRHLFYQQIKIMNKKILNYIVQNTNKNFLFQSIIQNQYISEDDESKQIIHQNKKSQGISYPQQLNFKNIQTINLNPQSKKVPSIQQIHLKITNPDKKLSGFNTIHTGQSLIRGANI